MTEKEEEEKRDEEAPQEGEACFVAIFFEGPGSAQIAEFRARGVSLNQIALAARELQQIADFEMWWAAYAKRMEQVEEAAKKKMEEEIFRRAIAQGGGLRPS